MRNEGGGFAEILRLRPQLFCAPLDKQATFSTAQDDETGRCPKVCDGRFPRIASLPLEGKVPRRGRIGHSRHERQMRKAEKCAAHVGKRESQASNGKDFSLTLEMTIRESFLVPSHKSLVTSHQSLLIPSY